MGALIFGLGFLFVGMVWYLFGRKAKLLVVPDSGLTEQLNARLERLKKELLAYHVRLAAERAGLSLDLRRKLGDEYGESLSRPGIPWNTEFGNELLQISRILTEKLELEQGAQKGSVFDQVMVVLERNATEQAEGIVAKLCR